MAQLEQHWNKIRQLLQEASAYLPLSVKEKGVAESSDGMLTGNWHEYEEFLEHNEFGLAWETLTSLGKRHQVADDFRIIIQKAAAIMGLEAKEKMPGEFEKKYQSTLSIFLEPDVAEFIRNYAREKQLETDTVVNQWLRNDIAALQG